ncbi:hypothetical protein P7C70_g9115, partial [Phenoliferia sp. Uapishka_3]
RQTSLVLASPPRQNSAVSSNETPAPSPAILSANLSHQVKEGDYSHADSFDPASEMGLLIASGDGWIPHLPAGHLQGRCPFYAVRIRHQTGVFTNWTAAQTASSGYPGELHRGFKTRTEAFTWLYEMTPSFGRPPTGNTPALGRPSDADEDAAMAEAHGEEAAKDGNTVVATNSARMGRRPAPSKLRYTHLTSAPTDVQDNEDGPNIADSDAEGPPTSSYHLPPAAQTNQDAATAADTADDSDELDYSGFPDSSAPDPTPTPNVASLIPSSASILPTSHTASTLSTTENAPDTPQPSSKRSGGKGKDTARTLALSKSSATLGLDSPVPPKKAKTAPGQSAAQLAKVSVQNDIADLQRRANDAMGQLKHEEGMRNRMLAGIAAMGATIAQLEATVAAGEKEATDAKVREEALKTRFEDLATELYREQKNFTSKQTTQLWIDHADGLRKTCASLDDRIARSQRQLHRESIGRTLCVTLPARLPASPHWHTGDPIANAPSDELNYFRRTLGPAIGNTLDDACCYTDLEDGRVEYHLTCYSVGSMREAAGKWPTTGPLAGTLRTRRLPVHDYCDDYAESAVHDLLKLGFFPSVSVLSPPPGEKWDFDRWELCLHMSIEEANEKKNPQRGYHQTRLLPDSLWKDGFYVQPRFVATPDMLRPADILAQKAATIARQTALAKTTADRLVKEAAEKLAKEAAQRRAQLAIDQSREADRQASLAPAPAPALPVLPTSAANGTALQAFVNAIHSALPQKNAAEVGAIVARVRTLKDRWGATSDQHIARMLAKEGIDEFLCDDLLDDAAAASEEWCRSASPAPPASFMGPPTSTSS